MKLILLLSILVSTCAATEEKVDDQPMPQTSIKCGECPCVNPCSQQQLPSPPPPKITQYCPPPPPGFVYFTGPAELNQLTPPPPRFTYVIGGPQGNLYPTDPFNLEIYNAATCDCNILVALLLLIICGLLQMLVFWGI